MRRLILALIPLALIPALLLAPAGCKRKRRQQTQAGADEPVMGLATVLNTADPRIAPQLVRGFHPVEGNAWRWTAGQFTVLLKPPAGAEKKGAILVFKFTIPDTVIQQLKPLTLSASVNGTTLPPETYSAPGDQTYSRDVPGPALKGDSVTVEFALDKHLPPQGMDQRELGVVASMIGFEAKP
jgi:hypothetical protein